MSTRWIKVKRSSGGLWWTKWTWALSPRASPTTGAGDGAKHWQSKDGATTPKSRSDTKCHPKRPKSKRVCLRDSSNASEASRFALN